MDASRLEGKARSAPGKTPSETRQGMCHCHTVSDGSDEISLVSVDWVLIRFNPKGADQGPFAGSPLNLSTLWRKPRGTRAQGQGPRAVVEPGHIGDGKGKGEAKYGM